MAGEATPFEALRADGVSGGPLASDGIAAGGAPMVMRRSRRIG